MCDNNENKLVDVCQLLLNNHTLTKESTEATIKANLEMLLNTLHNLKNDNDTTLINKSVTDYNDTTLINKSVTYYNDPNTWCNGRILIATDSMFNNIDETRLSKNKYKS